MVKFDLYFMYIRWSSTEQNEICLTTFSVNPLYTFHSRQLSVLETIFAYGQIDKQVQSVAAPLFTQL